MKIPKKVNICGITFTIKYKDRIISDGNDCYGLVDDNKCEIYIMKGLTPAQELDTYVHEVLHALIINSGIKELFRKYNMSEMEELIVRILTPHLIVSLLK
jgi:Zn-dependent peptidase ImmA (M78 family)